MLDLAGGEPAIQAQAQEQVQGGGKEEGGTAAASGSPEKQLAAPHASPHLKWPRSPSFKLQVRMGGAGATVMVRQPVKSTTELSGIPVHAHWTLPSG